MEAYILPTILGIIMGTLGRIIMLKTDYRQYPTYPHGDIIHLALGIISPRPSKDIITIHLQLLQPD